MRICLSNHGICSIRTKIDLGKKKLNEDCLFVGNAHISFKELSDAVNVDVL